MGNDTYYHLYPDVAQRNRDEYYAMVDMPNDGTATLFFWGVPIYTIRLSDKKVIFQEPDLNSKERKIVSDFKKHLEKKESYTDLLHYLYFNGDIVAYSSDGVAMFNELYQMLEDAAATGEFVDIPNCYLSRVPVKVYKDGSPAESMWEDERIYFRITDPMATIDDVLDIMDDTLNKRNIDV